VQIIFFLLKTVFLLFYLIFGVAPQSARN